MSLLTDSLWPGVMLWVVLYVSDYAFTLTCARMYQAGVREIVVFEGSFELTPFFEKDVDALRRLSPRFVLALMWGVGLIAVFWWVTRGFWPEGYLLALGVMVVPQLAVHVRHLRNYFLFRRTLAGRGVRGRIEYTRSFMLEMSAVELFSFAGLFLVASLCTWSPFLFGGAAVCLAHGAQQRCLAREHVPGVDVGGREGGTGPQ